MIDDANNVIGTGPFLIDEFVSSTSITFDRNPNYWKVRIHSKIVNL
jgi:ABC-type oligopeptide transport system substrate-binding subunit